MRGNLVRGLRIVSAILLLTPGYVVAEELLVTPKLIISEVKIRNDTAGFDEFIEIYNPSSESINLNDYFIGYINTPALDGDAQFDKAVIGTGLLEAGKSLVLAKDGTDLNLPNSQQSPFSSLSDSGGTLRITDNTGELVDQIAWSSTLSVAVSPIQYLCTSSTVACNLNKTQSFTREKDENDSYVLNNPAWSLLDPSPESSDLLPAPEPEAEPEPNPEAVQEEVITEELPTEEQEPTVEAPQVALLPLQITELLPNPAPPLTDTLDEFVEIYNPNDSPVDVAGYKVQTGNTYSYSYELENVTIPARGFITLTSGGTNLALANSGGKARLMDPSGVIVAETPPYGEAAEGQAWANIGGIWQWTTTATPLAENIFSLPIVDPKTPTKKAATTKKKTSSAKTTAKKASTKGASTKKPTTANKAVVEEEHEPEIIPVHTGTLAIIGGLTLVYAGYEYRHDVLNRLYQFRRYREARRAARAKA